MIWILVSILAAAVVVVVLCWKTISTWLAQRKVPVAQAELVKELLNAGQFEVKVGVFTNSGAQTASKTWTAHELDEELRTKFGSRSRIVVQV